MTIFYQTKPVSSFTIKELSNSNNTGFLFFHIVRQLIIFQFVISYFSLFSSFEWKKLLILQSKSQHIGASLLLVVKTNWNRPWTLHQGRAPVQWTLSPYCFLIIVARCVNTLTDLCKPHFRVPPLLRDLLRERKGHKFAFDQIFRKFLKHPDWNVTMLSTSRSGRGISGETGSSGVMENIGYMWHRRNNSDWPVQRSRKHTAKIVLP